jgi:flagellar motor component MotA
MGAFAMKPKKPEAHLQLLVTLFLIFQKSRREGLMSIEMDIERPRDSALFTAIAEFDEGNAVIYTVLCDALCLIVGGNLETGGMTRYLASARKTSGLSNKQESLFDALESSILTILNGCAPAIAVEFGRQCIPANLKPSFIEFEDYLRTLRQRKDSVMTSEETDASLVSFFAGITSVYAPE